MTTKQKISVGEDVKILEPLYLADKNVRRCSHDGKYFVGPQNVTHIITM
jgi:hypothetical protein